MSCFSVVPFKKSFLLGAVVLGILSLGACQKADIITQPDAPKNTATTKKTGLLDFPVSDIVLGAENDLLYDRFGIANARPRDQSREDCIPYVHNDFNHRVDPLPGK